MASGVEALFCDADPVTAGEAASALRDAGWEGAFLGGPALAASDFAAVAGQAAEGTLFVTPYPFPTDVPGSADFIAAYQTVSNGAPPGPFALPAYEAAWMLLEALERDIVAHGEPTREGMGASLDADVITFAAGHSWDGGSLCWYRIGAGGAPQRAP
jgi:ABC-type branched-subunit amino acid transport system substrate-binding protein